MTAEDYVGRVLAALPSSLTDREQIGLELRGHIAERLAEGRSLEAVLSQLGEPSALAASYGGAESLVSASHRPRLAAKLIDAGLSAAVSLPVAIAGGLSGDETVSFVAIVAAFLLAGLAFWGGTVWAEHRWGRTPGKHWMGLRVVTESGAAVSLGQAAVRQLPLLLQVFWIDAMFAAFTEHRQRAVELLSRTRVVRARDRARA